ncbi:MAG: DEAD/DEAH box helicase, partial [Betaproteobacteria bacterium]
PEAKAVVFSQWVGTHEMIERRLAARGWDYVLFHGGVPSERRAALIERFRENPRCRVFLSTDAGGVGLNLQQAATVINMDLPWNPAVLEQRIGRVHRLGQRRAVQVFNFIAQGTIEEGMLSLLGFKRSLFAGVLDGGAADVALNGTRLTRFMESVEKAAGAIRRPEPGDEPGEDELGAAPAGATEEPAAAATEPWRGLVNAGVELLSQLAAALPAQGKEQPAPGRLPFLETDPQTGRRYLRLQLPDPAALSRLAGALGGLLSEVNKMSRSQDVENVRGVAKQQDS